MTVEGKAKSSPWGMAGILIGSAFGVLALVGLLTATSAGTMLFSLIVFGGLAALFIVSGIQRRRRDLSR